MKINVIFLIHIYVSLGSYYDNIFDSIKEDENILVLKLSRLGLANRLRTIADWHILSVFSKRVLFVNWIPSQDNNISFSDIFSTSSHCLKTVNVYENLLNDDEEDLLQSARRKRFPILNLDISSTTRLSTDFIYPKNGSLFDNHKIVYTSYDGILGLEGISPQHHMAMKSSFYSNCLVPSPSLNINIETIMKTYFTGKLMIGIHFRSHDPLHDWAVVPPLPGQQQDPKQPPEMLEFGVASPLARYVALMSDIRDNFWHQLPMSRHGSSPEENRSDGSAVRFFVASNDDGAKRELLRLFPDSVALFGDTSRSAREGMQLAALELLLLSRTALIVHPYASTFALEAAQFRLQPLVGIWGDVLVHHQDPSLRHAGHMQFAAAAANRDSQAGRTEVHETPVRLLPCDQLRQWGLRNVYCLR